MKFEEILPEIRKGRRWRIKNTSEWQKEMPVIYDPLNIQFELEAAPREFYIYKYSDDTFHIAKKDEINFRFFSGNPPKLLETIHVREVLS